jgi:carboxypeptidase family protein
MTSQISAIAKRLKPFAGVILLIACIAPPVVCGQSTSGTLKGHVRNESDEGVPDIKILVVNELNGNRRSTKTNSRGVYRMPYLQPGEYSITADAPSKPTISGFVVEMNKKCVVKYPPNFTIGIMALTGKITDEAGRAAVSASVIVINEKNGNERRAMTDDQGFYRVQYLPPSKYKVIASAGAALQPMALTVPVSASQRIVYAPTIALTTIAGQSAAQAGSASQSGAASDDELKVVVNTTDAARAYNFSDRQIGSLPLGGGSYMRSFDELALLAPGVAPPPYTPGERGPGVGFGIGTAGQFSVNGLRARSNNFTVDGSDNNDPDVGTRRQGFVALVPQSIESIKEFQISTLLWDAEFGRNFGSQVNAVSKYGENKYHGQFYGFYTGSGLNARNFFDAKNGVPDIKNEFSFVRVKGFPAGEDPFKRAQVGIAFGGPIGSRAQFFGSYEEQYVAASKESHFSSPTSEERRFLGLDEFDILGPAPFFFPPFRGISSFCACSATLFYYPEPNDPIGPFGKNTFTELLPASGNGLVLSYRLAYRINSENTLNARYNFTDDHRNLPSVNQAINSTIGSKTRSHNLSAILDSALGPMLFNQLRFSFGRTQLGFNEVATSPLFLPPVVSGTTIQDTEPPFNGAFLDFIFITGLGEVSIDPFSPVGVDAFNFPQGRANNTFQIADAISWTRGDHSIKFGFDIRRIQLNSFQDRLYRPRVVYSSGLASVGDLNLTDPKNPSFTQKGDLTLFSGVQLAGLGLPSSVFQTITPGFPNSHIGLRFTEFNFFVNDNWRARDNLAIDYGLRYEYNTVPREVNNIIEDALTLSNLPTPGRSRFDTPERTQAFNAAVNAYRRTLDGRARIYEPDRNNFGPHVGLAWDPWGDAKTSIRAGYGIYFDAILGAVVSQSRNVFPNEIPVNADPTFFGSIQLLTLSTPSSFGLFTGPAGNSFFPDVFLIKEGTVNQFGGKPQDAVALIGELFRQNALGGGLAFTLPEKNLRTPYAQHWHATIEREISNGYLISAAYVGTRGVKLTRLVTPNLGPSLTPTIPVAVTRNSQALTRPLVIADLVADFTKRFARRARPIPELGAFQIFENSASSNYHALQLEARKRYNRGYTFTLAYTWSHAIDDVSDLFPIAGAPVFAQDSFDLKSERADANYDLRHRFAASLVWDLPFYRDSKQRRATWLGGWQMASIFQAYTGQPFTLNIPVDANLDGNLTDRPSTVEGLTFFHGHGPQRISAGSSSITDFFVFGQPGAVGRNTARGDSFINLDLSVAKNFRFADNQKLEFRTEFFNLLNRANFGLPVRTIGAPGFGSSIDTANPARIIQFALKYGF